MSIKIPRGGIKASESFSQTQEAGQQGFEYACEPVTVISADPRLMSALAVLCTNNNTLNYTIHQDEWPVEIGEGERWRDTVRCRKRVDNTAKSEQIRE